VDRQILVPGNARFSRKTSGGDMGFIIQPWHVLLLGLTSWGNRRQRLTIEHLITENQILKENSERNGTF
jgi:hypothetical protein